MGRMGRKRKKKAVSYSGRYSRAYKGLYLRLPELYNDLFRIACEKMNTDIRTVIIACIVDTIKKGLGEDTAVEAVAFVDSHYPPSKHKEYWDSKLADWEEEHRRKK